MPIALKSPQSWININPLVHTEPPRTITPFIIWCLRGTHISLAIATFASVTIGVVETYIAAMIGYILDLVLETEPSLLISEKWPLIAIASGFLLFVRPVSFLLSAYLQSVVLSPGVRTLVATRLHRWTMGHPKSFFDNDFAGRIAQKEIQASNALADVIVETIQTVFFAIASVIASFWIISSVDLRIGLVVVLWLIGFYFLMRYFLPRIKAKSAKRANAQAVASGQIVDTISNIGIVKLFANSVFEDKSALKAFDSLKTSLCIYGMELVRFRVCMVFYASLLFFLVMAGCSFLWTQGAISPGEVVIAGSVSLRIMMMAGWVSFSLLTIYTNLGDVHDAMETLAVPYSLVDEKQAPDLRVVKGEIEFEDVTYAYGKHIGGIKGISLHIKAREKLGIVGASGAGKSTFVSTLLRMHDPENGSVFIDGQNIRNVNQDSLRKHISMVTQETSMFNRSARENIQYGYPDATENEIIEASKRAGAHEFIKNLEDNYGRQGYEAHLGERGVKLSGGQRQRIALARAILKNAPILILDEATSALDSEVEAVIQEALVSVMRGKTVIAIAHRLSTISHMDRILVMKEGNIVEQGAHSHLLQKDGIYASFWKRQSGGFLGIQPAE